MDGTLFTAEILGTMTLILFGNGVVANVLLKGSKGEGSGWIVIATGWGFGVFMGVAAGVAAGGYGHINPAVTVPLAIIGVVPWGEVFSLVLGQFVGAFIGAVLVYFAYFAHWAPTEDPGLKLAVHSTGPAVRNTSANFITEFIGTFALVFGVLAIGGAGADAVLGPLAVGVLVWGIGLSLGGPTGYAINPARDLGPRIAHAVLPIAGKGGSDWNYSWIPVAAPLLGGAVGAIVGTWAF